MVLITTLGASSTVIGAIRSLKSVALAALIGSEATADRILPVLAAINVPKPSRTKSLRLMPSSSWPDECKARAHCRAAWATPERWA